MAGRPGRRSGVADEGDTRSIVCVPLASIPSPSDGVLDIGPLSVHVYGIMLAIGVVVVALFAAARWARAGPPCAGEFDDIVVWIVIGGLVGARPYHVATDWEKFEGDWLRVL